MAPHQQSFDESRSVDGQPPNGVMEGIHRFGPRTNGDATTATTRPFPLVHPPKDEALFRIDPPLAETGIAVDGVGNQIARLPPGNSACRAILRAALAGHAKLVDTERNRLVGLQWQVGRHRLEAHVVPVFRRKNSPGPAEFPDTRIQGEGNHVEFRITTSSGFAVHCIVAQSTDEISHLSGDKLQPAVAIGGGCPREIRRGEAHQTGFVPDGDDDGIFV